ncbi:MAG: type IA DNA topoisomerase [Lachnospiraceae bacterium]|jgi:DNA topoisomerase-3|nr:type IA DNA topoisomerase [Lachnospiraceae bacterium]
MGKSLFIAEKPSVAMEFAKVLKLTGQRKDGYLESETAVVTWCVGHLISMSYPESYDPALKRWSMDTLPFLPEKFRYEVIASAAKQYKVVAGLLNRKDVDTIYVCTDSGREGEYIYRLVEQQAKVKGKQRKRVWIDSQTEEEIKRGINEAKDLSAYDNLSNAAYLRAKEDYLMGINFSRILTLRYGKELASFLNAKWVVISVGRVMTCVLGMVVRRERDIRDFKETTFYKLFSEINVEGFSFQGEWKAIAGSMYYESPKLYKDNGFLEKEDAENLKKLLELSKPLTCIVESVEKKSEKKYAPLLYNLAELQNEGARRWKISPDETLKIVQELYEKKLVTYPRTDARVLSKAAAKDIGKNLNGLKNYAPAAEFAQEILDDDSLYKNLFQKRYVNDEGVTDHYAIIPTGDTKALSGLSGVTIKVYDAIVRRFLSVFYPPAVYNKVSIVTKMKKESFFSNFRALEKEGYLKVAGFQGNKSGQDNKSENESVGESDRQQSGNNDNNNESGDVELSPSEIIDIVKKIKKGSVLPVNSLKIKEAATTPPKRYNSGSLILAMENAGQLIEDEELRAQIKGSGIGTSATRGEILKKLFTNKYLSLSKKTQIVTPTLLGELIFEVVGCSIKALLNPELTASWEKGLSLVADGKVTEKEYMEKLENFVSQKTVGVKKLQNMTELRPRFSKAAAYYRKYE